MDPYDERMAAAYDASVGRMYEPAVLGPAVDFLAELADGGRVLEFAPGTGRVALPLSARGIEVHGIELSAAMVAELRRKPGGGDVAVTVGDMTTTQLDASFRLVYVVFNTISNLLTQDEQVDCFCNASRHLEVGGHFVIEVFVPALQRLPLGETLVPFDVSDDHVGVDEYDIVEQRLVSHHYWPNGVAVARHDSPHRWALPAEYDLMARIAGMELTGRWADWHRSEFTATSSSHVSVWTKVAPPLER